MSHVKDLTGKKFGRLYVIGRAGSTKDGRAKWLCKCGCGEYENRVNNVTSHRLSNTRLYTIWQGMKQRCYYPNHKDYHNYGGRGITICREWLNDFQAFF